MGNVFQRKADGLAAGSKASSWLLAFSMFVFLSLAFAKRYNELKRGTAWR